MSLHDDGKGRAEAIYLGNCTSRNHCGGNGPWVMADLEYGLWAGISSLVKTAGGRHSCPVNPRFLTRERDLVCIGLSAAVLLPRAYLALHDQGVIWPDEIFQTLEQGHRLAFGYGFVPWEFRDGARSWLLPGIVGGVMKALAAGGMHSGSSLTAGTKLVFAGLATLAFYPVLRMAYAWGGILAALLCGAVACAFPANLIYSSRAMSEVASAPFLTWGLWLLWPWGMGHAGRAAAVLARPGRVGRMRTDWLLLWAGVSLGFCALLRYQNAMLVPAVLLIVATRRSLRVAALVAVGAVLVLLFGGWLDWVTWGKPFHSLVVYVRFNLLEHGASAWGIANRWFYLRTLLETDGAAVLVLAAGFVAGLRRTWPVGVLALIFLGAHTLIPHKELRFLYPVLPLFVLCSAVGLSVITSSLPCSARTRLVAGAALALALLVSFSVRARQVSFQDIGQFMDDSCCGGPTSPLVWGAFEERNRLFSQAGSHVDLCGLAAPTINAYWTGGYSYLHRAVPVLWSDTPADLDAANFVLVSPGQGLSDHRYRKAAEAGPYALYQRDGACTPPRGSLEYQRLVPKGVLGQSRE
ncbi:MAG: arabinofuranosidase catalytic domain-containing protein [Polyangia bacterium]